MTTELLPPEERYRAFFTVVHKQDYFVDLTAEQVESIAADNLIGDFKEQKPEDIVTAAWEELQNDADLLADEAHDRDLPQEMKHLDRPIFWKKHDRHDVYQDHCVLEKIEKLVADGLA